MTKRAELSTSMLITIVILIIGFGILLFFFWQISFSGNVDKEACHTSIIFRATLPAFGGVKALVPLKCKTEKICITSALFGQNCPSLKGASGVTKMRVSKTADIEKVFAQSIVDCWEMTGEGKVAIFSQWYAERYGVGGIYPTCIICSRMAFDSASLAKSKINVDSVDVDKYMMTHAIPNKDISYYDFIAKEGGKAKVSQSTFETMTPANAEEKLIEASKNLESDSATLAKQMTSSPVPNTGDTKDTISALNNIDTVPAGEAWCIGNGKLEHVLTYEESQKIGNCFTSQQDAQTALGVQAGQPETPINSKEDVAVLFMQITAPTQWGSLKNIGQDLLIAGAAVSQAPGGGQLLSTAGKGVFNLCKAWPVGTAICAVVGVVAVGGQQLWVSEMRSRAEGYCGDVSMGTEARNGCSTVRLVKYDETALKQYCSVIESIP